MRAHWREYASEAAGLGLFMLSACVFGTALGHPASPVVRALPDPFARRMLMGLAMGLTAITLIYSPWGRLSGAHLNPATTLTFWRLGKVAGGDALAYAAAQVVGGVAGVVVANLMFGLPAVNVSTTIRSSPGLWLAEVVATFGLLLVIFGVVRSRRASVAPFAVGAYIGGAYFFTASTSFANPAVTVARTLSNTFAGIAPASAPAFMGAQLAGAVIALVVVKILYPSVADFASDVVVPHDQSVEHALSISQRAAVPWFPGGREKRHE